MFATFIIDHCKLRQRAWVKAATFTPGFSIKKAMDTTTPSHNLKKVLKGMAIDFFMRTVPVGKAKNGVI
jgi:hypothetical protein